MVDPFSITECMFVKAVLGRVGHIVWFLFMLFFIWKSIKISLTASSVSCLCSGHVFTVMLVISYSTGEDNPL